MNYVPISRPYAESVNKKFWIKYELNNNELIPLCTEFLERCCRNIETIKNSKSFGEIKDSFLTIEQFINNKKSFAELNGYINHSLSGNLHHLIIHMLKIVTKVPMI